jgi:hypothetical protein
MEVCGLVWDNSTCMRCVLALSLVCSALCALSPKMHAELGLGNLELIIVGTYPLPLAFRLLPRDIHPSADSFDCGSNCAQSPTSYTAVDPDAPGPAALQPPPPSAAAADTAPTATAPAKVGLAMLPPVPPGMRGYTMRDRHGPYGLSNGPAPI